MARSKRGRALFEVLGKKDQPRDRGDLRLPDWWSRNEAGSPGASTTTRTTPSATPVTGATPVPSAPRSDAPLFSFDGPRVVISLSSLTAGLTIAVLLALVIAAFLLGRYDGEELGRRKGYQAGKAAYQAETTDEIERARQNKPNTDIFAGLESSPVSRPTRPGADPEQTPKAASPTAVGTPSDPNAPAWVKGHTYIVVQEFRSEDKADAQEAQRFLADHGIPARILESSGRYRYRLTAQKGFNRDDPAQRNLCEKYHERIRGIGRQYRKAGGRYDLQGYQRKLTGERW